jgi:hypothetical protein
MIIIVIIINFIIIAIIIFYNQCYNIFYKIKNKNRKIRDYIYLNDLIEGFF